MSRFLATSAALHGFFLAGILIVGSLLSRPRMSYYSVDLFSSLAPGLPGGGAVQETVTATPAAVKVPEEKIPLREAIRIRGAKNRRPARAARKSKKAVSSALRHAHSTAPHWWDQPAGSGLNPSASPGPGEGTGGQGGSGIVAEGGPAFPFPWYLKAVADRLDHHWRPPQEFQTDTLCQVAFVIHRSGTVSGSRVEKPSGDSVFDQLALRAVVYSNPLPPLPTGFPEESLRVHMKFVGKPR